MFNQNMDPLGEDGGLNLYGFVDNDGVHGIDILGLNQYCDTLERARLRASLAAAVYPRLDDITPVGWTRNYRSFEGTGLAYAVFENDKTGQTVISFEGTDPKSLKDWRSNISQSAGLIGEQYALIGNHFNDVAALYPNAEVVGHSLGGGLASAFGTTHKRATTTFNAAGVNDATLELFGITRVHADECVSAFYVNGEILSGLQDNTTAQEAVPWYLKGFVEGLDLTPNAIGFRIQLPPDLNGDIGDEKLNYIDNLLLSVKLHDMVEVIQAIDQEIERCCKK